MKTRKKRLPFFLLALLCLHPRPVTAQDTDDDDTETDIGGEGKPKARIVEAVPVEPGHLGPFGEYATGPDPTAQEIEAAIARGLRYLEAAQRDDGSWGDVREQRGYLEWAPTVFPTGPTALALHALGTAGSRRKDPAVKRALGWLDEERIYASARKTIPATYEAAALILGLESTHPHPDADNPKHPPHTKSPTTPPRKSPLRRPQWRLLADSAKYLTKGHAFGDCQNWGWGYGPRPRFGSMHLDVSATHFAVTALRAAARAGYPFEDEVWEHALSFLGRLRQPDGSFSYMRDRPATLRTTMAATVAMLICREQLASESKDGQRLEGVIAKAQKRIEEGFRKGEPLGDHLAMSQYHYVLWTIQQYGSLTGQKLIGGVDWYAVGARALVRTQRSDGSWEGHAGRLRPDRVIATSFALMFLKRDTPPLQARK